MPTPHLYARVPAGRVPLARLRSARPPALPAPARAQGPAAFLVSVFLASYILSTRRDGLVLSIRLGAVLCFCAALLRCLPVCLSSDTIAGSRGTLVALLHVCQFANGAAAPFVVASPSLLSLLWFPEEQRNTATAVANVASALGRAVGFFLGPALVPGPDALPVLLVAELGLAALPLLAAVWLLPNAPLAPPSRAALLEGRRWDRIERARRRAARRAAAVAAAAAGEGADDAGLDAAEAAEDDAAEARLASEERAEAAAVAAARAASLGRSSLNNGRGGGGGAVDNDDDDDNAEGGRAVALLASDSAAEAADSSPTSVATLAGELRRAAATPSFLLLCAAGGLEMAIYGMWSGVLPAVLTELPGRAAYSDVQAGAFGSVNTFAGILGGLLAGAATDAPWLRRRLVPVTAALLAAAALFFAAFALPVPPLAVGALAPLAGSYASMMALVAAAGLLRGGADPLFFELAAESVAGAGVPAGTAGAVLTFFYHLVLVALLAVPPATLAFITMPGMALCLALSALMLLPVRITYTRR